MFKSHSELPQDITLEELLLPQEITLEELLEFWQQAIYLDMTQAVQIAHSWLVESIESLELSQEHADLAIEIQKLLSALNRDQTVQDALNNYFQKYISSINFFKAENFIQKEGEHLRCLDLSKFNFLNDELLDEIIKCCPNLQSLTIDTFSTTDSTLKIICSALPIYKCLKLNSQV